MYIQYDVTVINRNRNISASFVADSFFVKGNRLIIKSESFGNVTVEIEPNEELEVKQFIYDKGICTND